ncbi:rhodanese-like domain-containing protein [Anaerosinus gibii]|uniref:Rhodanese-like domain-containing protein n=1 Tax=Selenobaculum gibii TaxID=3054208 RepID=A0A9Y2AJ12_9FIRM|nr:rhodanese-like domain-containing protein [Selenobaculum gbiensis]WIW70701.1 rhodanese-like domain-containing protein [Selenobaculum gbiensis]
MNKILLLISMIVFLALILAGCANANTQNNVNNEEGGTCVRISGDEAKKIIDENRSVIILDVRTPAEYKIKHIPGAILISNETITNKEIEGIKKSDTVLVYCRSGNRSREASEKLIAMGYKHVYDFGGIDTWQYETESDAYQEK